MYLVLRTGENQPQIVASIHSTRNEAIMRMTEFTSHGHKQTYEVIEAPEGQNFIVGMLYESHKERKDQ